MDSIEDLQRESDMLLKSSIHVVIDPIVLYLKRHRDEESLKEIKEALDERVRELTEKLVEVDQVLSDLSIERLGRSLTPLQWEVLQAIHDHGEYYIEQLPLRSSRGVKGICTRLCKRGLVSMRLLRSSGVEGTMVPGLTPWGVRVLFWRLPRFRSDFDLNQLDENNIPYEIEFFWLGQVYRIVPAILEFQVHDELDRVAEGKWVREAKAMCWKLPGKDGVFRIAKPSGGKPENQMLIRTLNLVVRSWIREHGSGFFDEGYRHKGRRS